MTQTIKIKRSTGSAAPSSLARGELAFSKGSGTLYIGDPAASNDTATPIALGGAIINNAGTPQLGTGVTKGEIRALVDLNTDDNVTFNNLTLAGNLTVSGTTTTVNSETVNIADNFMLLNSDQATDAAGTENAGLEVNRGNLTNVQFRWSETADRWQFSNDGSTFNNIPVPSEYAPGDITRVSITAGTGIATSGSTDVSSGNFITTLSVDLSELTDMTSDVNSAQDELILLDNGADRRKKFNEIPINAFRTSGASDLEFEDQWLKLNQTSTVTSMNGGIYVARAGSNQDAVLFWDESEDKWKFGTEGLGNSIGMGDITAVNITAGTGLTGTESTSSGDHVQTLALDFSELTDMTGDISGSTELILQNGSTESRKAASEIKLSAFNNDSGWTSKSGDITSIAISSTDGSISGTGTTSAGAATFDLEVATIDGGTY